MNRKLLYVYASVWAIIAAFTPLATLAQGGEEQAGGSVIDDVFGSSNEVLFALMAPAFIPWVVALIVQTSWAPILKQIITFGVCILVALGYLLYQDETVLSWDGLPRLAIIICVVAYGYYRIYHKPVTEVEGMSTFSRGGGS